MGLRETAEQRWFPRYRAVSASFTGRLCRESDGQALEARIVDVSRNGVGALLSGEVKAGEAISLVLGDRQIGLVAVYCIPDLIHKGSYRCGLQRRSGSADNLVSLFAAMGVIDD